MKLLPLALALPHFFGVAHREGRDWLLTPAGKPFWSFAVDCVDEGKPGTAENPSYDGKKLFPNSAAWATDATTKLRTWGFNCLGGWCDTDLLQAAPHPLPYIEVLHLGAYNKAPWNDLYAPEAKKLMGDAAHTLIPRHRNDPNLIGYCTDNELGWWDDTLFLAYQKFPATAPGKIALVESLRHYYHGDFKQFQRDWVSTATSFEDLKADTASRVRPGSTGIRAVHAFNFDLARQYYRLVRNLVKAEDPHHLLLGDRYCQYYNLETAEAIAPYTDVVTTNDGADWLDGSYTHFMLDTLHRLTEKPVMITEFYFAARENRSGSRNSGEGFPTVQTQKERAAGFAACVRNLASRPYVVGAHWFQFYDEPKLGRGDGEDFNMGMLDVYGKPYKGMIQASAKADPSRVHRMHGRPSMPCVPPAPKEPMKNRLLNWDRERGYIPSNSREQWADLYACHQGGQLYLGLIAMEYIDETIWPNGKMVETDRPTFSFTVNGHPATVRFNGKGTATCSDPAIKIVEARGLKHTLTLKLPKSYSDAERFRFSGSLSSHGHGYVMSWQRSLQLR